MLNQDVYDDLQVWFVHDNSFEKWLVKCIISVSYDLKVTSQLREQNSVVKIGR